MYEKTEWIDHAVTPERTFTMVDNRDGTVTLIPYGTVVQQGTNMNAVNFNNIENGVEDAHVAQSILAFGNLQENRFNRQENQAQNERIASSESKFANEVTGEIKTVTLKNTAEFPFNSTMDIPITVALAKTRKTKFYTVDYEITEHTGEVGDIYIIDKALNGFKLAFDGCGSSVTVTLRIKGGMN